ncbi:hypothetical protein D918_07082 [Trichuris suis]|nr:hypothetical protein D918_07082 [Trichuris suis]
MDSLDIRNRGTLICDVGAAVILIHRSFRESQYGLMTAMQCLINVPSILLYSVGEPVMTLCSLIMSLDYCLTLTVSKPACKITERTASVLIAATVTISSVNALLTFLLLSALIYMATAIITAAKKSTFPVVRLQQIRRQEAIMNSAFPVRIFCAKLFAWLLLVKSKVCLSKAKVSAQGCSPTKSLDAANRE